MKKLFIAICSFVIVFCSLLPVSVYAGSSAFHDSKLKRILFSSGRCTSSDKEKTDKNITMLEYASYLCLDQCGNKSGDKDKLDYLVQNGVKGIAKDLSALNPETPFLHRSYTHRGWTWSYIDDKSNWEERKAILINTVATVFKIKGDNSQERTEALAELIYYVHIIGDLYYEDCKNLEYSVKYDNSEKDSEMVTNERGLIISLANAHPGNDNRDVFYDLDYAISSLFETSQGMRINSLKSKMKSLAKEARDLESLEGGVNTLERLEQRCAIESELIEVLESYLPLLLDDQDYFKSSFPS